MKFSNFKLSLVLVTILASQALAEIYNPKATHRKVVMHKTFNKLKKFIASGAHKEFEKSEEFNSREHPKLGSCTPGEKAAWKFLGFKVAMMNQKNSEATWTNHCFKDNKAVFKWNTKTEAQIEITQSNQVDPHCSDTYALTDIYNHDLKVIAEEGKHTLIYTIHDKDERDYISQFGLKILRLCDHHTNLLADVLLTLKRFIADPIITKYGKNIPDPLRRYIYRYHYEWSGKWEGIPLKKRKGYKVLDDPKWFRKHVKSGDFFFSYEGTGLQTLVMWGTGSNAPHTGMFMWGNDKHGNPSDTLYVLQSNEDGINQKTIEEWLEHQRGEYQIIVPMAPKWRAKFNIDKAWDWYQTVDGLPYGINNFFFSWLDTPDDNFPQITGGDAFYTFLMILEEIPFLGPQIVDTVWNKAMNKRLGTEGLTYREIIKKATERGMDIGEVVAIPEKEEWNYEYGKSYVCSCFGAAILLHSGMFGDITYNPQEFAGRDVFMMNIWDKDYDLPEECQQNDPDLPYCQIAGDYKIIPRWYSTIDVYQNMNDHCPSRSPDYFRPEGCQSGLLRG